MVGTKLTIDWTCFQTRVFYFRCRIYISSIHNIPFIISFVYIFCNYITGTYMSNRRLSSLFTGKQFKKYFIRCTTLFPPFFFRNLRLYCKKLVIHLWFKVLSIAGHYFLPSFVAYESCVEKTGHLLRLSTNRSNFLLLHKTGSDGQSGRVPLIETNDSQREQRLENTAG